MARRWKYTDEQILSDPEGLFGGRVVRDYLDNPMDFNQSIRSPTTRGPSF